MNLIRRYKQFILFSIVASVYNAATYLFYALLLFIKCNYLIASTVSYIFGVILSYFMNKALVFTDNPVPRGLIFHYFFYYTLLLIFNLIALHVFVDWLKINPYLAQVFVTMLSALLSYSVLRRSHSGILKPITTGKARI